MVRIAIVDDHPVAQYGVRMFLEGEPEMVLAAAVDDPRALPRTAGGAIDTDLLVMDLYLTDDDEPAIPLIAEVCGPVPILVMSASRKPADVLAAIQAGAAGFLTKQATREAFLAAVRGVLAGEIPYLSPQLADVIQVAVSTRPEPPNRPALSAREQDTLSYIARGFTHQQTASRMGVSPATVNTYIARIRTKLQVGNKAELALAALRYVEWRRLQPKGF